MPANTQFSGPRTAQIWFLSRCLYIWYFPGMILISLQCGYFDSVSVDEFDPLPSSRSGTYLLFAPLFALLACAMPAEIRYPLRRTAGSTKIFVQSELFLVWLLLVAAAYSYWLPIWLASKGFAGLSITPLLFSAAIASSVQAMGCAARCLRHQVIAVLAGIVPVQLAAFYGLSHLNPFDVSLRADTLLALIVTFIVTYQVSVFFARRFRYEESLPVLSSSRWSAWCLPTFKRGKERARLPFSSNLEASAWYEHRQLLTGSPVCCFMWLNFIAISLITSSGLLRWLPGTDSVVYALTGFSMVVVLARCSTMRVGFEYQLPVSDWSLAVAFLRAVPGWLLGFTVMYIGLATFVRYFEQTIGVPDFSTLVASLLIGLWTGWVGIAFATGMYPTLLVALFSVNSPGEHLIPVFVVINLVFLFIFLALDPRAPKDLFRSPTLAAPVTAALGVLFATFLMPGDSTTHWCCRELLGAAFVAAWLYHLHQTSAIPTKAASKIARVLALGALASCAILVVFGTPERHNLGPASIFIGFGLVPPLFLPLLVMQRFAGWMRTLVDRNRQARRKLRWIS